MPYMNCPAGVPVADRGYSNFGGWFDSVVEAAKSVIPENTIVGKALRQDYSGAISGAVKFATAKSVPIPKPTMVASPGIFSPGGFVEKNQTVLLLGAAGLAAFLILSRRRGRR